MVETSAPELFSATRRKFGEVLRRADLAVPKPMDFSLMLGLRLPGKFLHIEGQMLQRIDTGTSAHVALFQFSSVCVWMSWKGRSVSVQHESRIPIVLPQPRYYPSFFKARSIASRFTSA